MSTCSVLLRRFLQHFGVYLHVKAFIVKALQLPVESKLNFSLCVSSSKAGRVKASCLKSLLPSGGTDRDKDQ